VCVCVLCSGESGRLEQAADVQQRLKEYGSSSLFPEMALEIDAEPDASEAVDENEAKLLADFERRGSPSSPSPRASFRPRSLPCVDQANSRRRRPGRATS